MRLLSPYRPLLAAARRWLVAAACGLGAMLVHGAPAIAAPGHTAHTPQLSVRLLASAAAVYPGETLLLGLEQRLQPHWHTYWRNPGDSGTATRIDWTLPPGVTAGDIRWPVPQRFQQGPVSNYGYAGQAVLLVPVHIPASARPGQTLPLQAAVSWLVCRESCIPQETTLTIKLPVLAAGAPRPPGRHADLLRRAQQRLPRAQEWPVGLYPLPVSPASTGSALPAVELRLQLPAELLAEARRLPWPQARFFPEQWGQIDHGAAQPVSLANQQLSLQLTPGEAPPAAGQPLRGLLVLDAEAGLAYELVAAWPAAGAAVADARTELTLWPALLLALLGGLVLNLMPCVFPVLSLKALSLVQHARLSPAQLRWHGAAYTVGVLASFALLAAVLLALQAAGQQVGWGFQFQSPGFVLAVALLLFGVGLNLSGVFTFGAGLVGVGAGLAERPGYAGSFFTGVLATVVATPCTAPFMGAALGFALTQPPASLLAVLLSLGLGLALPYLALTLWPPLQRRLPRPGVWMERFKQLLAFPMYLTAVWLVWVLAQQQGADAVALALAAMVALVFAAWVWEVSRGQRGGWHRLAQLAATVAVVAVPVSAWSLGLLERREATPAAVVTAWENYTPERLEALRAQGQPVFVNLTAAWCITCLANERLALRSESVGTAFRAAGITYLKGDWTHRDPQISALLRRFDRSGVPLYLYYPPGAGTEPVVLPQLLTPGTVLAAIGAA